MKLQNEIQFATEKLSSLIKCKGLATIKEYMYEVYEGHEWKNFEIRISNDIVKYAAIGTQELTALLNRNPAATDQHLTTLCIYVMKAAGLLPFNPEDAKRIKAELKSIIK